MIQRAGRAGGSSPSARCVHSMMERCEDRHRATWFRRADGRSGWTAGLRERFRFGFDNPASRVPNLAGPAAAGEDRSRGFSGERCWHRTAARKVQDGREPLKRSSYRSAGDVVLRRPRSVGGACRVEGQARSVSLHVRWIPAHNWPGGSCGPAGPTGSCPLPPPRAIPLAVMGRAANSRLASFFVTSLSLCREPFISLRQLKVRIPNRL
jgi:hypothetical protein